MFWWGLGIGDWGLGGWANTPYPKHKTQKPKKIFIKNKIYKI